LVLLASSSCVYGRILYYNVPTLSGASPFDERVVRASLHPVPFQRRREQVAFPMRRSRTTSYATFEELVFRNDTRALLVLHHDVIVYEGYLGPVTAETALPSFSMTKTFAAALVGCAVGDGLIDSVDRRLVELVPALAKKPGYEGITLDHLLRMTSGIDFKEESVAGAVLYYTTDLQARAHAYDMRWPPGVHYEYGSVNMQLLWEVLKSRLGARSVASYFEERFWDALGAEEPAAWALDGAESGVEKFSGGLSAVIRDYARIGVLFQHRGFLNHHRILAEKWVSDSLALDPVAGVVHTSDGAVRRGRYQWFWTLDAKCYFAKGYNGQYVFVDPTHDVVVVRFGEGYGDVDWTALFAQMAASL
jgi:CubicO group peptidase (beta-lactamase class C family)